MVLKQASIAQVKDKDIPREKTRIVIAMRFYPRFLRKELRDEFVCELAPEKQLLHEFNAAQKRLCDHNPAFAAVDYEHRFKLSPLGREHLTRLAQLSAENDVYLVCICALGGMCHREMLMLMAQKLYGSEIGEVFHAYPDFMKRLPALQ
jgi:uncharacterized protein YeaO (DUF488 family)